MKIWYVALLFAAAVRLVAAPAPLVVTESEEKAPNGFVFHTTSYRRGDRTILERRYREGESQVFFRLLYDDRPVLLFVKNPLDTGGLDRTFISHAGIARVAEWDLDGDRVTDYILFYRPDERQFCEIYFVGPNFEVRPVSSDVLTRADGSTIDEGDLYYAAKKEPAKFKQ